MIRILLTQQLPKRIIFLTVSTKEWIFSYFVIGIIMQRTQIHVLWRYKRALNLPCNKLRTLSRSSFTWRFEV